MRFGLTPVLQLRVVIAILAFAYGVIQIVFALRNHGVTMNFDLKHGIIFAGLGVVFLFLSLTARKKSLEGTEK